MPWPYLDWVRPPELGPVDLRLVAKELEVDQVAVVGPRAVLQGAVLLRPKVPEIVGHIFLSGLIFGFYFTSVPEVSLVANGLEVRVWDEEDLAVGVDYRIGELPPHFPSVARAMRIMSGESQVPYLVHQASFIH